MPRHATFLAFQQITSLNRCVVWPRKGTTDDRKHGCHRISCATEASSPFLIMTVQKKKIKTSFLFGWVYSPALLTWAPCQCFGGSSGGLSIQRRCPELTGRLTSLRFPSPSPWRSRCGQSPCCCVYHRPTHLTLKQQQHQTLRSCELMSHFIVIKTGKTRRRFIVSHRINLSTMENRRK